MRIAVLAHIRHPVSPPFRGGMEAHSWQLARGLLARGHDVALLASGDSDASLPVRAIRPEHYEASLPWGEHHGTSAFAAMLREAYRAAEDAIDAGGFDVVHNNALHPRPHFYALARRQPTLTSLHVPPFPRLARAVRRARSPWQHLTVTSRAQAESWWPERVTEGVPREAPEGMPETAHVVHNGIDLAAHPFSPTGNGEAVWAGRIAPNKAPALAIRAARQAGVPLTLFGPVEDEAYFEHEVKPLLGGAVRLGGLLASDRLAAEIGRRSVCLFTPVWDEPFGLVAAEAMAAGLPVAGFDAGAVREVVGEAGALAPMGDVDGLARMIGEALAIPRAVPRARVERLFSLDRMLDGYEAVYAEAIAGAVDIASGEGAARPASSRFRMAAELA